MNKTQFIERLAQQENISKKQAHRIVNGFLSLMEQSFYNREEISFLGFGSFSYKRRGPRVIANSPLTGSTINVPPRVTIRFTPASNIKKTMNKQEEEAQ